MKTTVMLLLAFAMFVASQATALETYPSGNETYYIDACAHEPGPLFVTARGPPRPAWLDSALSATRSHRGSRSRQACGVGGRRHVTTHHDHERRRS